MLVNYENTTRKLAVIGDPVLHSLSPLLQNTMLRALGEDYLYLCQPVAPGDAEAWLNAAKLLGYAGFNCTMPHKVVMVPLMDELDEDARRIGAVNTVCLRDGKAYGYNTDGRGFVKSLRTHGIEPRGKRITILGTGGAAKSVALKLLSEGAAHLTVCNRTISKAERLCEADPARMTALGFTQEALTEGVRDAELLVNCTSLGMNGIGAEFESFAFLDALSPSAPVCDLIYSPPETALLRTARLQGHQTLNGLGLLVYQAIYALEHFIGKPVDAEAMAAELKKVVGEF